MNGPLWITEGRPTRTDRRYQVRFRRRGRSHMGNRYTYHRTRAVAFAIASVVAAAGFRVEVWDRNVGGV